jgi:hypothetical protein
VRGSGLSAPPVHARGRTAQHARKTCPAWLPTLLWFGLALLSGVHLCAGSEVQGKTDPEWDALFERESGWIGADGNYSIPLGGDTTLWLFSDTFVGKVKDGKRWTRA